MGDYARGNPICSLNVRGGIYDVDAQALETLEASLEVANGVLGADADSGELVVELSVEIVVVYVWPLIRCGEPSRELSK